MGGFIGDYMIKDTPRRLYRHEIEKVINENEVESTSEMLDLLFGTHEDEYESEYIMESRWSEHANRSLFNRINLFWVVPLFTMLIPIRYLMFGNHHVSKHSKLGEILTKIIGELP